MVVGKRGWRERGQRKGIKGGRIKGKGMRRKRGKRAGERKEMGKEGWRRMRNPPMGLASELVHGGRGPAHNRVDSGN